MSEYAKIWKNKEYNNIELLSASFKKFSYSKHWHDEYAIGLIQKGVEGLDFNGSKIHIPQNNIVAINPGEVHTGFSGSKHGWTYRMFYLDTQLIKEVLSEQNIHTLPSLTNPKLDDSLLFNSLLQLHISLEEEQFTLKRDSLLISSITSLFSKYSNIKFHSPKKYKDFAINNRIKDYLFDNYKENITLDELSILVKRDKYQIIRNFKVQFGITPHQFLILLKIKKSKEHLEKGLDITNTALECGFFDQSHMSRNFKSIYGLTPGLYQNSLFS
ncbi:AraC family transcriptional regulator [Poseidonibacter lekithochrous]|uniref:AraC family transcriptional regulator n=1 Tax=Poseidonibacter lekithochrous TaxID=1904463 RepID=UPI0008FCA276|nr:AraC family transcriptional regulator [Poseidonibacter lekithochrous]QKJ23491.1 transcriptional regulator, AraC family [Poseidonibacter lekithochrous]